VLALLGAWVYGAIAAVSGRSGGEYRYLSDYVHPVFGYVAGWASLLMGFSAPIALDAIAVGAFTNTLVAGPDPRVTGTLVILALTAAHTIHLGASTWTQNVLVLAKMLLIGGFVVLGLSLGDHRWPQWEPPHAASGFPLEAFVQQQYWSAFAFTGWNAAIYVAAEFKNPRRDVPAAMVWGAFGVGVLYLVVNAIFVTNLTPEMASAVFQYEESRITLAHEVMTRLLGPWGGRFTSVLTLLACVSAMSAMVFVGPRVYAQMADDGFLPRALRARDGRPPTGSVLLQSTLAIVMVWTQSVLEVVQGTSLVLMFCTALTALSLFFIKGRRDLPDPSPAVLVGAVVFVVVQLALVVLGAQHSRLLTAEIVAFLVLGVGAYLLTRARQAHGGSRA
jgi:APA family basic amino acid/polyamine antiporter